MGEGKHAGKQPVCARCVSPLVHVRCESGFVMVISRALAQRDRVPQEAPSPSQGLGLASTPYVPVVCGIRRRKVSLVSRVFTCNQSAPWSSMCLIEDFHLCRFHSAQQRGQCKMPPSTSKPPRPRRSTTRITASQPGVQAAVGPSGEQGTGAPCV